jgi:hypothetical protein
MTTETAQLRSRLVNELQGNKCFCGARKRTMQAFCRRHYFALPPDKRQALWKGIFEGYVSAYQDARRYLKAQEGE